MKIRVSLTVTIARSRDKKETAPDLREIDMSSAVEMRPQPSYSGFTPNEGETDGRNHA